MDDILTLALVFETVVIIVLVLRLLDYRYECKSLREALSSCIDEKDECELQLEDYLFDGFEWDEE